jgi:phosphatidylglycerophosphate synthase
MSLMNKRKSNNKVKINIDRSGKLKTIFYILILVISLFILQLIFGWKTLEEIPSFLQPYSIVILWINPYLTYIQAVLIFILGYLLINVISSLIYMHFIQIADHPTAAAIRSI